MNELDHIPYQFQGKVAQDLLAHTTPKKEWDMSKFNSLNDYQRHLFALFLRLSGMDESLVWAKIYVLSKDVSLSQRQRYVNEVLHSAIVGFPQSDGSLIPIPNQVVEV